MHTPVVLALIVLAGLTAETLYAQKPKAPAPAAPAAAPGPPLPAPPPNFQYSPDGRRDPFVDLVNRGSDALRGNNAS
ncbi:MAG: hypothetical protein Q8N52_02325, partial [Acidobacteriota bacterium]|nr:hypothetical protein [Acidobacteriota bacterium]